MRLLVDTHTFLWFVGGDSSLSLNGERLIRDPSNEVLLSIASVWELAIKINIGKFTLSQPLDLFISQQTAKNNILSLGISIYHTGQITTLPLHHRDPFDRMLIAQAMVENIPIISRDSLFDLYNVQRVW